MKTATPFRLGFDRARQLSVYSWGEGPAVLLVHGWSSRASQMAVFAAPLVERGFRVVAFDQPSHGSSDGRRAALPDFARAVEVVATCVGSVHGVVAHSLGTAATTLALSRGVDVQRLAYLAPPEDLPGYLARLSRFLGFRDAIPRMAQSRLERRFGVPFDAARGASLGPKIQRPLLVVHDISDRQVPIDEGQTLVRGWGGPAQLVTTQGLGHTRLIRDDGVVKAVVDFITEVE
jgi:pimeloyl-ACP methyl ester carboxylesterase